MNMYQILKNDKEVGKMFFDYELKKLSIKINDEYCPAVLRIVKNIVNKGEFGSVVDEENFQISGVSDFFVNCLKQELFVYLELIVSEE